LRIPQLQNIGTDFQFSCYKRSPHEVLLHRAMVCDPNRQQRGNGALRLTCHPERRQGITAPAKAECQLLLLEIPGLDKCVKMPLSLFPFLFSAAPGMTCYLPSLSSVHISWLR